LTIYFGLIGIYTEVGFLGVTCIGGCIVFAFGLIENYYRPYDLKKWQEFVFFT
jgi:hypothetical protein